MNRKISRSKALSATNSTTNSNIKDYRVLKRNLVFIYGIPE